MSAYDYSIRTANALARYRSLIEQSRDLFVKGASVHELQVRVKLPYRGTQSWVRQALAAGLIFSNHRGTATRYFLDFDDMTREAQRYADGVIARKKEQRALRNKTRRTVAKPKPAMPQTYVKRVTAAGAAFKAQTAHRPAHVKVQRCPTGVDQRFTPCEPFPKIFSSMRIGTYL